MTTNEFQDLEVEYWPIDKIKPYEKNVKIHSENHIQTLIKSISEYGLLDPLIVDKNGVIIAGHGRFEALKRLGHKIIPVRCAFNLSPEQVKAARIAHNKTASNEYDVDLLTEELNEIALENAVSLESLGLSEKELSMLTTDIGEINEDVISFDIVSDIEEQEKDIIKELENVKEKTVPLTKVIGLKRIKIDNVKHVERFMSVAIEEYGEDIEEALINAMKEYLNVKQK